VKILVTISTPLDNPRFGNIDLNSLVEARPTSPASRSPSIKEHLERPSLDKKIIGSKSATGACYVLLSAIKQLLSYFPEKERLADLEFLNACQSQLLVTYNRIKFVDSDA
jgi:hypothetical protein